jgi:hypothetical protein
LAHGPNVRHGAKGSAVLLPIDPDRFVHCLPKETSLTVKPDRTVAVNPN